MDTSPQEYPACVGLCRTGNYPNRVEEVWNDGVSRKTPWYLRPFHMSWLGLNRKGSYLKIGRKDYG